ncbi:MAG TPA: hypothetical protein VLG44_08900 [Chlamydiales bacterium]|nr:hypothetical protein [Chlamydiales bacterium]
MPKKKGQEEEFEIFSRGYVELLQLFARFMTNPKMPGIKKEMEKVFDGLIPHSHKIGGKLEKDVAELKKPLFQFLDNPTDLESLQRSLSIMESIRNEIAEL